MNTKRQQSNKIFWNKYKEKVGSLFAFFNKANWTEGLNEPIIIKRGLKNNKLFIYI